MSKTTLDLSTLSDISDGTHIVKVKAKADGYSDSEFSNEVSYTKAPAGYSGTITLKTGSNYYLDIYDANKEYISTLSEGSTTHETGYKFYVKPRMNNVYFRVDSKSNCSTKTVSPYISITCNADNWSVVIYTYA